MIDAMRAALKELEDVLDCINQDKIPFDGDDFHETLRNLRQAIAEAEKQAALQEISDIGQEIEQAHTDHPARHWDRTCPACVKEAEKQEPVAYVNNDGFIVEKDFDIAPGEKLYLAPPKREWVGLTHEEIRDAYEQCMPEDVLFARAIEDKLREKNT